MYAIDIIVLVMMAMDLSDIAILNIKGADYYYYFFFSGISYMDTDNSQDNRERKKTIFYSTVPLPSAHENLDIYLQLCKWDDYQVFLIVPLVFTRLLLDEIYHLIELLF